MNLEILKIKKNIGTKPFLKKNALQSKQSKKQLPSGNTVPNNNRHTSFSTVIVQRPKAIQII